MKIKKKIIKICKRKKITILIAAVVVIATILLLIFQPFNERKRKANKLINSISTTQKLNDIMIVSNFQYTFIQNGKSNKTIVQGVYASTDKKQNILLKGDIDYTSELNSTNDYKTTFDIIKKDDKILEKIGAQYKTSDLKKDEFAKMIEDFQIYNFSYSDVKEIRKTDSIDKSTSIYEIVLDKIPKKLIKNYVESINLATGEKFTEKDLKINSFVMSSNVSKSILKSQQLRISLEAKSKTNVIQIRYISEINITDDEKTIKSIINK